MNHQPLIIYHDKSSQRVRCFAPAFVDKNSTHAATIELATTVKTWTWSQKHATRR